MELKNLIESVKEGNLSIEQLESYRDQLSSLYADMMIEMSTIEKEEAQFMGVILPDESVAKRKVEWKATSGGQRLIVLKRYSLACKELLNSLKSRIFRKIY